MPASQIALWRQLAVAAAPGPNLATHPVPQVVRLLGAGGFGEVWLCRWHSSEVAVKCLNPSLFLPDGGMGTVSEVRGAGGCLMVGAEGAASMFRAALLYTNAPCMQHALTSFADAALRPSRHCASLCSLLPHPTLWQDVVSELLREADMLGGLRHPNIVWVYGVCLPPLELERLQTLAAGLPPSLGVDVVQMATAAANSA